MQGTFEILVLNSASRDVCILFSLNIFYDHVVAVAASIISGKKITITGTISVPRDDRECKYVSFSRNNLPRKALSIVFGVETWLWEGQERWQRLYILSLAFVTKLIETTKYASYIYVGPIYSASPYLSI